MESKEKRILMLLKKGSLNRFEAEKHGDHCLPSTVSILKKKGYSISSHMEKVPNRFGGKTSVKRYYIQPEIETATELTPIAI